MDILEKLARLACFSNCTLDGEFCSCHSPMQCIMWDREPMQAAAVRLGKGTKALNETVHEQNSPPFSNEN